MASAVAAPAFATSVLTASGAFTDTQTVTVGGKVYTTQTTLTNSNGNVFKGADAAAGLQNLYDAINLTGNGDGSQYAAAMTINTQVKATAVDATTLTVTALSPGAGGNQIATTETQTNASWTSTVMAGGSGNVNDYVTSVIANTEINAEVLAALKKLTVAAD